MNPVHISYWVFGIVLVLALVFDLGLLSTPGKTISAAMALRQTAFWVGLALAFGIYFWIQHGSKPALEYVSAYLMEWSLSIDNIFVFILIFSFFKVEEPHAGRVLLIGIILAIVLRGIFIAIGVALVGKFNWLLYVFGAILVYSGITMFFAKEENQMRVEDNRVYRWLLRVLPLTTEAPAGKFWVSLNGRRTFTPLFVVVVLLATTDIVFALDSLPAVFGITQDQLVIYTSNIFAVLGLRSMFFLLKSAVRSFKYLPQGIAAVLIFIGLKMLAVILGLHITVFWSLGVILACIGSSMLWSLRARSDRSDSFRNSDS